MGPCINGPVCVTVIGVCIRACCVAICACVCVCGVQFSGKAVDCVESELHVTQPSPRVRLQMKILRESSCLCYLSTRGL